MLQKTGLEDYFIIKDQKKLRYGYTTGSCAAAAAKAAATMLLTGIPQEEVSLMTPKGILLHLAVEDITMDRDVVSCAIRKDGGDDPDATHGILVYATVRRTESGLHLDGGKGVGRVTKPGLQQAIGEAAINRTPRKMILEAAAEACESCRYQGGLDIVISVPEGEAVAAHTFNPRLGIMGGISILGTSGIVVPMSEAALIASIEIEMKMLLGNGAKYLVMTPGNYGEVFSKESLDVDTTYSMHFSNFLGETLEMAENLNVKGMLFIAHIGKFIKVSGGIMNTHSHRADSRAELMAAAAMRAGASMECCREILDTLTTEEAVKVLDGYGMLAETMEVVMERVMYYLKHQIPNSMELGVILFSNVYGKLAQSSNAEELIRKINEQKGENHGR